MKAALFVCATLLAILATCLPAQAALLTAVDWGGTGYVGANLSFAAVVDATQDWGFLTSAVDYRRYQAFSESTPLLNVASTSGKFYGGFNQIAFDDNSAFPSPTTGVFDGGASTDEIQFRGAGVTAANGGTLAGVVVWQKADFLNGANALSNVYLTADTDLTITIGTATTTGAVFRMVVKNSDTYYVSNTTASIAGATFTISDPTTETWAIFNPGNGNNMFTDIGGSFTTRTFDDVEALGVYLSQTANLSTLVARVSDINFLVSDVPEPATMALMGLGSLGMAILRLRRSRR